MQQENYRRIDRGDFRYGLFMENEKLEGGPFF